MITLQPYNVRSPSRSAMSFNDCLIYAYCHNPQRFGKVLPQIAGEPMLIRNQHAL